MSLHSEMLATHPIFEAIGRWRDLVLPLQPGLEPNAAKEVSMLIERIDYLDAFLTEANIAIIDFANLDSLAKRLKSEINGAEARLTDFRASRDVQHIRQINNIITSHFREAPIQLIPRFPENTDRVLEIYQERLHEFQTRTNDLLRSNNLDSAGLAAENERISARFDELDDRFKHFQRDTDASRSEWQQQFSASQESRLQEFSDLRDSIKSETQKKINGQIEEAETRIRQLTEKSSAALEKLEESSKQTHDKILEIYKLSAADSTAGSHIATANREKGSANFWRFSSVSFIISAFVWLIYAYNQNIDLTQQDTINWARLIMSFSVTGILLYGASFTAKQSDRHRQNERAIRQFALEVTAIEPFISDLPEDKKQAIKAELTDKLFGGQKGSLADDDSKSNLSLPHLEVIKLLIEKIPSSS